MKTFFLEVVLWPVTFHWAKEFPRKKQHAFNITLFRYFVDFLGGRGPENEQ